MARALTLGFLAGIALWVTPAWAQEEAPVNLTVASEPADASVFIRYTTPGKSSEERFIGRTREGSPLTAELAEAGPAEIVVFKDGFVCKVEDLELRSGGSARLEVRLTRDVSVPRNLVLKGSPAFVRDARDGLDELYLAVLGHAVNLYIDELDPRALIEASAATMVEALNAIRSRELLLRRELPEEARRRYYGEELDLRDYPPLRFERAAPQGPKRGYKLVAGGVGIAGETEDGDLDTYLAMLHHVYAFLQHRWDARRLLSDAMLTRCAIEGLLGALGDDHTHFMTPDDVDEMAIDVGASFGGVGIVVSQRDGRLTVIAPMEGTPGERAGILAGDWIMAIDGATTTRMSMKQAVDKMRGEVDSPVEITIKRGERDPFTVTVVRADIKVRHTAQRLLAPGIGYLRITSFMHERLNEEVTAAIDGLVAQGAKGLVIDLRNNPGGLLQQAYLIANLFVREGVIVSTRTRIPGESRKLEADPDLARYDFPLVVLINSGSASASEILAGTLKEHHRATLVGEKSFGKGSVQRVLPLERFGCALALTVATYHLPSGATPHKVGVMPDVLVPLDEEQALRLLRRNNYLEGEGAEDEAADVQLTTAIEKLRAQLK